MSTQVLHTDILNGRQRGADYQKLFIIGCPRSGTTWVQLLLSQIPGIATAPETQIFAYYIDQLRRQWRHEHEGLANVEQGSSGLSRLLSEGEFDDMCRNAARLVLDRIAARTAGARLVVEKSPKHALSATYIQKLFPDAFFLHVVRDPRDTVASLLGASRGWGRGWAPGNALDAAQMWKMHVEAARAVSAGSHYLEIRYESLRVDPVDELQRILTWLGFPADQSSCEAAVAGCDFNRLRTEGVGELPMPAGRTPRAFFRKGVVGGWRDDLTRSDVAVVEYACGSLMQALQYEPSERRRHRPLRIPIHNAIQRVSESVVWQLSRLLNVI